MEKFEIRHLFIATIAVFMLLSCGKGEFYKPLSNCARTYIWSLDMEVYKGQDRDCNTILSGYRLDGKDYFQVDLPCADYYPPFPITDCHGNIVCDFSTDCNWLNEQVEHLGIVALKL